MCERGREAEIGMERRETQVETKTQRERETETNVPVESVHG